MAREAGSGSLLLVAAASALGSSLLTLTALRLLSARQQAEQRALEADTAPACAPHSNGEALPQPAANPFDHSPRAGALSWDDYFMAVAFLSAQRSKDPVKQVGACIVNDSNVICGIGYNGFPRGCSDAALPWAKKSQRGDPLETKYPYVCHAEMNAILNKNGASVAGARVYVTMFPCNECAKLMIQAGIREVVFHEAKEQPPRSDSPISGGFNRDQQYAASRRLLALAGVRLRQHLFSQPVLLRLTNDAKQPASMLADSASSSRTASEAAEGAAGEAEVAPAVAAALQHAGNGSSGSALTGAAAAAAVAGAAPGRRRRGRRQGGEGKAAEQAAATAAVGAA